MEDILSISKVYPKLTIRSNLACFSTSNKENRIKLKMNVKELICIIKGRAWCFKLFRSEWFESYQPKFIRLIEGSNLVVFEAVSFYLANSIFNGEFKSDYLGEDIIDKLKEETKSTDNAFIITDLDKIVLVTSPEKAIKDSPYFEDLMLIQIEYL